MLKIIRFVLGLLVLGFVIYNHQKVIQQINVAMETSEEYEGYDDEDEREDNHYAYDDYDTNYDY